MGKKCLGMIDLLLENFLGQAKNKNNSRV